MYKLENGRERKVTIAKSKYSSLPLVWPGLVQPSNCLAGNFGLNLGYIYNFVISVCLFERFILKLVSNPKVLLNGICVFDHIISLNVGLEQNFVRFEALKGPQTSFMCIFG